MRFGKEKAKLLFSQALTNSIDQSKRMNGKANRTNEKFNKGTGSKLSV